MTISLQNLNEMVNGNSTNKEDINGSLSETPVLPETLYELLSEPFKNLPIYFNGREKDILTLSMIVGISSILWNSYFIYDKKYWLNQFLVVSAPPASGKGVISYIKNMLYPIHKKLLDEGKEINKKAAKDKSNNIRKKQLLLFYPENSSAAGNLKLAGDNDGWGLIIANEADDLNNAFKIDWGNYSTGLRKSWSNEPSGSYRKTDDEYIEIEILRYSMILTGTYSQIFELIKSPENGLFSRIGFYFFSTKLIWKNQFKQDLKCFEKQMKIVSEELLKLWSHLRTRSIEIKFKDSQIEKFNSKFERLFNISVNAYNEISGSTVKRAGVICLRIAGVLSVVDKWYSSKLLDDVIECTDKNFEAALIITDVLLQHSLIFLDELSKYDRNFQYFGNIPQNKFQFYNRLPNIFTRSEAVNLSMDMNISTRTMDAFLKNINLFQKLEHGKYQKLIE